MVSEVIGQDYVVKKTCFSDDSHLNLVASILYNTYTFLNQCQRCRARSAFPASVTDTAENIQHSFLYSCQRIPCETSFHQELMISVFLMPSFVSVHNNIF